MEFIKSNWKPLVAELVGTSLLVFAGSAVMIVSPEFQIEMKRSISGAFLADPGLRFGMTLAALAVVSEVGRDRPPYVWRGKSLVRGV